MSHCRKLGSCLSTVRFICSFRTCWCLHCTGKKKICHPLSPADRDYPFLTSSVPLMRLKDSKRLSVYSPSKNFRSVNSELWLGEGGFVFSPLLPFLWTEYRDSKLNLPTLAPLLSPSHKHLRSDDENSRQIVTERRGASVGKFSLLSL